MALQALGAFAERVYSPNNDLNIQVTNGDDDFSFTVDSDNSIVLQQYEVSQYTMQCSVPHLMPIYNMHFLLFELQNKLQPVKFTVSGEGLAFAKVSWFFHLDPSAADPEPFVCNPNVKKLDSGDLQLSICCKSVGAFFGRSCDILMVICLVLQLWL